MVQDPESEDDERDEEEEEECGYPKNMGFAIFNGFSPDFRSSTTDPRDYDVIFDNCCFNEQHLGTRLKVWKSATGWSYVQAKEKKAPLYQTKEIFFQELHRLTKLSYEYLVIFIFAHGIRNQKQMIQEEGELSFQYLLQFQEEGNNKKMVSLGEILGQLIAAKSDNVLLVIYGCQADQIQIILDQQDRKSKLLQGKISLAYMTSDNPNKKVFAMPYMNEYGQIILTPLSVKLFGFDLTSQQQQLLNYHMKSHKISKLNYHPVYTHSQWRLLFLKDKEQQYLSIYKDRFPGTKAEFNESLESGQKFKISLNKVHSLAGKDTLFLYTENMKTSGYYKGFYLRYGILIIESQKISIHGSYVAGRAIGLMYIRYQKQLNGKFYELSRLGHYKYTKPQGSASFYPYDMKLLQPKIQRSMLKEKEEMHLQICKFINKKQQFRLRIRKNMKNGLFSIYFSVQGEDKQHFYTNNFLKQKQFQQLSSGSVRQDFWFEIEYMKNVKSNLSPISLRIKEKRKGKRPRLNVEFQKLLNQFEIKDAFDHFCLPFDEQNQEQVFNVSLNIRFYHKKDNQAFINLRTWGRNYKSIDIDLKSRW